jgi:hypothetical protein
MKTLFAQSADGPGKVLNYPMVNSAKSMPSVTWIVLPVTGILAFGKLH